MASPNICLTRVTTPVVLQMEQVECGAAALSIILRYYGLSVPLSEVREACAISRDGVSIVGLIRAAMAYGLEVEPRYLELEDLEPELLPLLIHWTFGHYVVLEGAENSTFFINDPGVGRTEVPFSEFDGSFTGIALSLRPSATFTPGDRTAAFSTQIQDRLRGTGKPLAFVIGVGILAALPSIAQPLLLKVFVDDVLGRSMGSWLGPLALAMALGAGTNVMLNWLQLQVSTALQLRMSVRLSSRFFWHLLGLPMRFFEARAPGELTYQLALNEGIAHALASGFPRVLVDTSVGLVLLCLILSYSPLLALVCIVVVVIQWEAVRRITRVKEHDAVALRTLQGKLYGVAGNGLNNIEALKATESTEAFYSIWSGYHARTFNAEQQIGRVVYGLAVLPGTLLTLGSSTILMVGALEVLNGDLTLGMLVAVSTMAGRLAPLLDSSLWLARNYYRVRTDVERTDDTLREAPVAVYAADAELPFPVPRLSGRIELAGLTFGYNREEQPLLSGFSLVVEPGQRVALVGATGSGKSTVARLAAGALTPWAGEILFDNVRRERIPRGVLTNSLCMIDQDISLFAGSVRDNLTLWNRGASTAALHDALADAQLRGVIEQRPGGLDAEVIEGGANFSGGERQRLELAQVLATGANILILDEAMSALDPEVEREIDDAIRRRGCTCLIVAHRLSTIRDCDEIVVLHKGSIVERGTHEQLLARGGVYRGLLDE